MKPCLLPVQLIVAALLAFPLTCQAASQEKTVKLIVDFGDGSQFHFDRLKWRSGMDVLDAMEQMKKHPRGVPFSYRGQGATALLTEIDGVKNQEGGGRNWIFRVNDKLADRSFAIFPLKQGDVILWKFDSY